MHTKPNQTDKTIKMFGRICNVSDIRRNTRTMKRRETLFSVSWLGTPNPRIIPTLNFLVWQILVLKVLASEVPKGCIPAHQSWGKFFQVLEWAVLPFVPQLPYFLMWWRCNISFALRHNKDPVDITIFFLWHDLPGKSRRKPRSEESYHM